MSNQNKIVAVRGMNDIYGVKAKLMEDIQHQLGQILQSYGYAPIILPVVEHSQVFERSLGSHTDIVEKEMYTFSDRNNQQLTLRPEATAGCVRAMVENNLLYNQTQKVYYTGPMFRYERPQKGRYRQFFQLGVEAFGIDSYQIDAELILISNRFWQHLGIKNLRLEINTIGDKQARENYRKDLIAFYESNIKILVDDGDGLRRLRSNPLRNLDSKNEAMIELNKQAPKLLDYLEEEASAHFKGFCELLASQNIAYTLNPKLVRGMDYYNRTVFEWVSDDLGAQGTICAGGRYDGLVELFGYKPTSGIGFAIGIERLVELYMQQQEVATSQLALQSDVFLVTDSENYDEALQLLEKWRTKFAKLQFGIDYQQTSFKSQLKKADRSGAQIAIILGSEEAKTKSLQVKYLRTSANQIEIKQEDISNVLNELARAKLDNK